MQTRFFVSHNGEEVGPFSMAEIFDKLKTRQLWSVDYIYLDDQADWITLEEFQTKFAKQDTSKINHDPLKMPTPKPEDTVELAGEKPKPPVLNDELTPTGPLPDFDFETKPATAAVTKVTPPPPTSQSAVTLTPHDAATTKTSAVQLSGGMGVIDLAHFRAETLRLSLIDQNKNELKIKIQTEVQIKSGQASRIVVSGESKAVAGQDVQLHLEAQDSYGNVDHNFNERISCHVDGSARGGGQVLFKSGRGLCIVSDNVAEKINLAFVDLPKGFEAMPQQTIAFAAGPAVQYIIETPKEAVAGQNIKVTVKAVDAFGNLATDATGTVQLNVHPAQLATKNVS
jgi:hypothetical protein